MHRQSKQFYIFYGLIVLIYALNIGGNAIWTTHEAYYAEAVREMLESGIWSEFFFNYEPRFQKPPMTYWLMGASAVVLGLSEFSLRLPIVICSLLTVLVVYHLGKLLYSEKIGLISMLIFSMSLQFVWFRHYASPEIPLTFFLTLSFYWFCKGNKSDDPRWIYGAFIILGLAVLTKGFPYLILFFSIVILSDLSFLKRKTSTLIYGLLLCGFIGLSWPVYMAINQGNDYTDVLFAETIGRAMGKTAGGGFIEKLLFYPQTLLWSVFPFSLVFYYWLIRILQKKSWRSELSFPLIWLLVFLVVFTISSGKLPVYILQAHPAIALIVGYSIVHLFSDGKTNFLLILSFAFPAVLIVVFTSGAIITLSLSWLLFLPLVVLAGLSIYFYPKTKQLEWLTFTEWGVMAATMFVISLGLMPWVEQFRPYQKIASTIEHEVPDKSVPLYIEGRFLDNLPYYAGRKVIGGTEWTEAKILNHPGEKLVLLKGDRQEAETGEILWQGLIHAKGPEDHFFKFIRDCYLLAEGDSSRFMVYRLMSF